MKTALERLLALQLVSRIGVGSLVIVEPGGLRRRFGAGAPEATIHLHSHDAWAAFLRGSLGLADAYVHGLWDSPDLVALIRLGARNMPAFDRLRMRAMPIIRPIERVRASRRPDGREQRRRDVAAHYDLGNDLFSRMLDPTMTYSCAVFEDPHSSLAEAQLAKLELVCRRLDLGPNDRVLEIGTGWGSFAIHAAATRGCHVTTTTISHEQHEHVLRRINELGLHDRITVLKKDFHDLRGRYDKLVSIEMIEAVGWRNIGHFLGRCSELLEPDGAMLLQTITIDDRAYEVEKASRSFIKEFIFPGGSLPSLAVIADRLAHHSDLQMLDLNDITPHYVETLRHWRERFTAQADTLSELGYDERFQRIWTLYLAYCEGGFAERRICDVQLLLAKPRYRTAARAGTDSARLTHDDAA